MAIFCLCFTFFSPFFPPFLFKPWSIFLETEPTSVSSYSFLFHCFDVNTFRFSLFPNFYHFPSFLFLPSFFLSLLSPPPPLSFQPLVSFSLFTSFLLLYHHPLLLSFSFFFSRFFFFLFLLLLTTISMFQT